MTRGVIIYLMKSIKVRHPSTFPTLNIDNEQALVWNLTAHTTLPLALRRMLSLRNKWYREQLTHRTMTLQLTSYFYKIQIQS
jgi:hypothetical protein